MFTLSGPPDKEARSYSETPAVDGNEKLSVSDRDKSPVVASTLPVTIYLSDETTHEQVEEAVENLLLTAGGSIDHRDDPEFGSWFRRMRAKIGTAARSPVVREAAALAAHATESRFVLAQDATITATMMENLGPVISALQPTTDAVIRVGALLIVKVNGAVVVHQLTATQQLRLDHRPQLAASPHKILAALELPACQPEEQEGTC
jgi:phage baseplate assembly protein W